MLFLIDGPRAEPEPEYSRDILWTANRGNEFQRYHPQHPQPGVHKLPTPLADTLCMLVWISTVHDKPYSSYVLLYYSVWCLAPSALRPHAETTRPS